MTGVSFALCLRNKPVRLTALFVTLISSLRKVHKVGTHPDACLGVVSLHGGVHFHGGCGFPVDAWGIVNLLMRNSESDVLCGLAARRMLCFALFKAGGTVSPSIRLPHA